MFEWWMCLGWIKWRNWLVGESDNASWFYDLYLATNQIKSSLNRSKLTRASMTQKDQAKWRKFDFSVLWLLGDWGIFYRKRCCNCVLCSPCCGILSILGTIGLLAGLAALITALSSSQQSTTRSTSESLLNRRTITDFWKRCIHEDCLWLFKERW